MKQEVYVLGGSQTDFERNWTKEGKNFHALLREVTLDGLKQANFSLEQVKELNKQGKIAVFMGNFAAEYYVNQGHLGPLLTEVDEAFYGVPSARYEAACASGSVALDAAMTKLRASDYEVAIVIGWEMMKTVDAKTGGDFLGRAALYHEEAKGIDYPFPQLFGKLAEELIAFYDLDEAIFLESLAEISAKNYANAKRNPSAQTRKWYMSKEQANRRGTKTNPAIGGKLAIADCSQVTDGAAVVVLANTSYVDTMKAQKPVAVIKGWGHRVAPMVFNKKMAEDCESEYILPWTRQAVVDAYQRANLTVDDIDVFETHDCFTSSEYVAVSSFGITEPGQEHRAILDGMTAFNGKKPINPSGGLIGCGHPVGASGVRMLLDLTKQVTKTAGDYQVPNAKNGLMLNIGGSATTNYVYIVGTANE